MQSALAYAVNVTVERYVRSKRVVKVRELIKQLEEDGWTLNRTRGSHRQYRHPKKSELRTLTVSGNPSDDVPRGTLAAILKQAGLMK